MNSFACAKNKIKTPGVPDVPLVTIIVRRHPEKSHPPAVPIRPKHSFVPSKQKKNNSQDFLGGETRATAGH